MQRIVKAGLYTKSKQLLLIEKCICLTIFFVNLFYKFSAMHLPLALVGFQNAPEFTVNEVCFEEENKMISLIRVKNQEKIKLLLNGVNVGNGANACKC